MQPQMLRVLANGAMERVRVGDGHTCQITPRRTCWFSLRMSDHWIHLPKDRLPGDFRRSDLCGMRSRAKAPSIKVLMRDYLGKSWSVKLTPGPFVANPSQAIPVSQSVSRSVSQSVSQSVGWSVSHSFIKP